MKNSAKHFFWSFNSNFSSFVWAVSRHCKQVLIILATTYFSSSTTDNAYAHSFELNRTFLVAEKDIVYCEFADCSHVRTLSRMRCCFQKNRHLLQWITEVTRIIRFLKHQTAMLFTTFRDWIDTTYSWEKFFWLLICSNTQMKRKIQKLFHCLIALFVDVHSFLIELSNMF